MIADTYKYDSVTVARYIVAQANERRVTINMTKLQKLLYIAYGLYLAVREERLTDEHAQAWPYGPVFPRTRRRLLKTNLYDISLSDKELDKIKKDNDASDLIDLVFRSFGAWTAGELTAWSHGEGTPWESTVSLEGFKWGDSIPDELIQSYFKLLIDGPANE